MKKPKNPVVKGRMYKVSGGGAVRGIRFNQNGTTDVLVVPGQKKRNSPKKKKARKKRKNAGRMSLRKSLKRHKRLAGFAAHDTSIRLLKGLRRPKKRKLKKQNRKKKKR